MTSVSSLVAMGINAVCGNSIGFCNTFFLAVFIDGFIVCGESCGTCSANNKKGTSKAQIL